MHASSPVLWQLASFRNPYSSVGVILNGLQAVKDLARAR
jgi:hypothetical protein